LTAGPLLRFAPPVCRNVAAWPDAHICRITRRAGRALDEHDGARSARYTLAGSQRAVPAIV
jgi:hypothetical protein